MFIIRITGSLVRFLSFLVTTKAISSFMPNFHFHFLSLKGHMAACFLFSSHVQFLPASKLKQLL